MSFGVGAVIWSSLGNVTGIFMLSAAAMLGLGALLMSSAVLFAAVKVVGALYLFYIGMRHLFGKACVVNPRADKPRRVLRPNRLLLYGEALLIAVTNPTPILFFTALFPQFIRTQSPLLLQFCVLTGIFMTISFCSLMSYALMSSRARHLLAIPRFVKWMNSTVGTVFIGFGALLLVIQRPVA